MQEAAFTADGPSDSMADVDRILSQLRSAAATKGTAWLQGQVSPLLGDQASRTVAGGRSPLMLGGLGPWSASRQGPPPELCATMGAPIRTHQAHWRSIHRLPLVVCLDGILCSGGARRAGQQEARVSLPHSWWQSQEHVDSSPWMFLLLGILSKVEALLHPLGLYQPQLAAPICQEVPLQCGMVRGGVANERQPEDQLIGGRVRCREGGQRQHRSPASRYSSPGMLPKVDQYSSFVQSEGELFCSEEEEELHSLLAQVHSEFALHLAACWGGFSKIGEGSGPGSHGWAFPS